MLSRRDWLVRTVGAGAAFTLFPGCARRTIAASVDGAVQGATQGSLIMRAVPSTGERLPIVGLGSSATFSRVARSEDVTALREVLRTMVEAGGSVFDTAPSYGASEEVAGRLAKELGITDRIFWATKVNVARQGTADPAAARAQIQTSFDRIGKRPIDLIQVHNLADIPTQLGILQQMKADGLVRYIGTTSTSENQYPRLMEVMRNEPLDFIGVDYAIDNREAEQTILPLAQERKIGVLVYVPFGRTRLWSRVAAAGQEAPPAWASEFDASTWAQFFIKFVAAHPAVTVVTPATSQPRNMLDNMGAARGRLPDAAMRQRMIAHVDALPPAPARR